MSCPRCKTPNGGAMSQAQRKSIAWLFSGIDCDQKPRVLCVPLATRVITMMSIFKDIFQLICIDDNDQRYRCRTTWSGMHAVWSDCHESCLTLPLGSFTRVADPSPTNIQAPFRSVAKDRVPVIVGRPPILSGRLGNRQLHLMCPRPLVKTQPRSLKKF